MQHAALARRDDLVELQAESPRVAEGAQTAAAISGSGGLADVLDQHEIVLLGDRSECVHRGGRPAHVHGEDRAGPRRDPPLDIGRIERHAIRPPRRGREGRA